MGRAGWWIAALFVLIALATAAQGATSTAAVAVLTEREVRGAVERFLAEKVQGRGWETTITQLAVPQGIQLPKGQRDLELIAPSSWDGWGPVTIALVVRVDGEVVRNISLRLLVDARTAMVVARRQLLAGTVVSAADLAVEKRDLAQAGGFDVKRIADVVGKRLKSTVRTGAPVRSDQLLAVPVVRSGQLVTIIADNAGFRITVTGRAKSSGGVGDLIRVENLNSHREIPARVLDSDTVEVGL